MNEPENPFKASAELKSAESQYSGQVEIRRDPDIYEIGKFATNSLVLGVLGFLLCMPYFFSPFAIYSGNRALKMIDSLGKGEEFRRRARNGRRLGMLALSLLAIVFVGFLCTALAQLFLIKAGQ